MSGLGREHGRIVSVELVNAGDELVGGHSSGVTALVVGDAYAFSEDGGTLSVGGDTLTYTGWDDDTNTIALSTATTSAYDDGDRVNVLPLSPTKTAQVVLDGLGDSVPARVLHVLDPLLREGVRDPDDQEYALLLSDGEGYLVLDVLGKTPSIDPTSIPSTGGDIDPDDVVFIDGAPDSFYHSSSTGYMDYATAVTFAGSTFVDAVAAIVADAGHIEVAGNTIAAVGGATHRVYPTWHIPTNGKQCRVVMDAPTVGTGTGSQDLTFEVHAEQDLSSYSSSLVDNYLYSFDFDSAPDGMSARIWYDHVGLFGDVETSLPAGAIGSASTSDFQLSPQVSLTPSEAGVTDPAAPYIVISLEYPVASWGGAGSNTSQSFVINNLRVIRE